MAKVAQYEGNQVASRVTQQPLAQGAPAGAFGAPVAEGLMDVVQSGLALKKRVDTTSAEESLVNFERDKNDLFFNPDSGYFNTQGRNAYDNSTAASKALEDLKMKYGETLSPQAQSMFNKAADAHIMRGQVDISRHSSKGLKAWEISTIEAQVENSVENAALYWNDPDRLRVQNVLGRQAIIESADMMGLGAEAKAEKLQTFDSAFAKNSIEAATQSSSVEGKKALDNFGDRLEGPDKLKIEKAIEAKAKVEKTAADAQAATLKAGKLVGQYDTKAEVIEEVNKIEDPELRKKTMSEAMSQYTRKQQAQKEIEADYYDQGIEHFNTGGSAETFKAQNAEAWEGMTPKQRNNLLAGKHMTTDQIKYNELLSLPRTQLAEIQPAEYTEVLKPSDLKSLRSAVDKAKKGQSITSVQSPSQKITRAAEQFFGKKSTWKGDKSEKVQSLMTAVQDEIESAEELKGGRLAPSEIDDVINDFSRKFVVERSMFGLDYLSPDLDIDISTTTPEQVSELSKFIDQHGEESLQLVTDKLKEKKKPLTIDTILNTFRQGTK